MTVTFDRDPTFDRVPVQAQITYTQLYFENPRQRNHRERSVTEAVTVHAPVLDANEAPLLMTGPNTGNEYGRADDAARVPYRVHDGQVYRQRLHDSRYAGRPTEWTALPLGAYLTSAFRDLLSRKELSATGADVIAQRLQDATDQKGWLLIDGQIYEPCGEPAYHVRVTYYSRSADVSTEVIFIGTDGKPTGTRDRVDGRIFPADQGEQAYRYAEHHARLLNSPDPPRLPPISLDVSRPDLLRTGRVRTYTTDVDVTVRVQVSADATDPEQARLAARAQVLAQFRAVSSHPDDVQAEAHWPQQAPAAAGDLTLNLPAATLHVNAGCLRVCAGERRAELPLRVPADTRAAVLAAAALLLQADQDLGVNVHPEETLAPLRNLSETRAVALAALLGHHAPRLAQRATRGQLSAALPLLLSEIDRILGGTQDPRQAPHPTPPTR